MKQCSKCNTEKSIEEFSKNKGKRDGRMSRCKQCESLRKAESYPSRKVAMAEYSKKYRAKNKSTLNAYNLAYRENNKEKIAKRKAEHQRANPGQKAVRDHRRRSLLINAEGAHSHQDVIRIFGMQRGLCANCGSKLFRSGKNKYHVDHIFPLSKGGSNWPSNLQCLCPTCNIRKNATDPFEWAKKQGRLI